MAIVLSTALHVYGNRYDVIVGDSKTAYKVDRILGEVWQISRLTYGDMSKNDSKSGTFLVDFGVDGARDVLAIAYLSGNTMVIDINRTFTGDGTKVFRFIRTNQANPAKAMLIFMEGFKRIGE